MHAALWRVCGGRGSTNFVKIGYYLMTTKSINNISSCLEWPWFAWLFLGGPELTFAELLVLHGVCRGLQSERAKGSKSNRKRVYRLLNSAAAQRRAWASS